MTMSVQDGVKVPPEDVRALIISPNLVAARFIQLTPAYTEGPPRWPTAPRSGPTAPRYLWSGTRSRSSSLN